MANSENKIKIVCVPTWIFISKDRGPHWFYQIHKETTFSDLDRKCTIEVDANQEITDELVCKEWDKLNPGDYVGEEDIVGYYYTTQDNKFITRKTKRYDAAEDCYWHKLEECLEKVVKRYQSTQDPVLRWMIIEEAELLPRDRETLLTILLNIEKEQK